MKTAEYLDAVKAKLNLETDYKVAKALGVPDSLMSKYRRGKSVPGPLTGFKIAEILGDQPAAVIADLERERAEKMEKSGDVSEWDGLIKKIGGGVASILLVASMGLGANADAASSRVQPLEFVYIVSTRRRWIDRLRGWLDSLAGTLFPCPQPVFA